MSTRELLDLAHAAAVRYLASLADRKVCAEASSEQLRTSLGGELPAQGLDAQQALADFIAAVEPGLVQTAGPRYFGFVTGGSMPGAVAADWLTSAYDQNAFGHVLSPAASVVEEVVSGWLLQLFGLPTQASVGFVTGGQMANFSCLCAARDEVLRRVGHDVEQDGLSSSTLTVFVGGEGHTTIYTALRMLGIGRSQLVSVAPDEQGRMRPDALQAALSQHHGPAIVCAQVGNVNTGAFDPLHELVPIAQRRGAWLHVDGAFGLWAAVSDKLRDHLRGVAAADSWAVDAHKWLNVPYDSGLAIVADRRAHYQALRTQPASYLIRADDQHDGSDWVPEASRRARAFPIYVALRTLGREGLANLIERSCELARRMAQGLASKAGATIANEVVLNQVLVRFEAPNGDHQAGDQRTRDVIERVQREGVCWAGPTVYRGRVMMRVALSNWSTREHDVDLSVAAIARASQGAGAAAPS